MSDWLDRRSFLAAAGGVGLAGSGGCTSLASDRAVTVFHAGSLAPAFAAAEPAFEDRRGVEVTREAQGSVASTRKITDQGRAADVLAVSDFRLLRDRLLPGHGSWYAVFATNAMTIHYTGTSPGVDDLDRHGWWEVLTREGVTVGHSDPAADPGGYRAVMAQQLGAVPFEGERLYDGATYEVLRDRSTVPTNTETELVGQLQAGELDYAVNYRSVGEGADVGYLDLQPAVDLSRMTPAYADHYANAVVETPAGTFVGAPIAYGIAVPDAAEEPALGASWVEFLLGDGRHHLEAAGLEPTTPAIVPERVAESAPESVLATAETSRSLGPLEL